MPARNLKHRLTQFGIDVSVFARSLPNDAVGFTVKKQLVRSSTSVGANYREACNARSKVEFVSKLQVSLQESDECEHWLQTVNGTMPKERKRVTELLNEGKEISAILARSVLTAKASLPQAKNR